MLRLDVNDENVSNGSVYIKSIELAKESEPGYVVENPGDIGGGGIYYPDSSDSSTQSSSSDKGTGKVNCGGIVSAGLLSGLIAIACAMGALKKKKNA